jgi:copper chaperone
MSRVILGVKGMDTPEAVRKVRETLQVLDGVIRVDAGIDKQASVEYDPASITVMDFIRALRKIGFIAGME